MKLNSWNVARNVKDRIQDKPGPAGDFMKALLTPREEEHFFFNTNQVRQFMFSSESKQRDQPGHSCFQKIGSFLKMHFNVGELYMEYLKGSCKQASGLLCYFCTKFPLYNDLITWAPRPKPDESALPRLQYLPYDKTTVAGEDGSPRVIYDFQPRRQLRKMVQNGSLPSDENQAIAAFC